MIVRLAWIVACLLAVTRVAVGQDVTSMPTCATSSSAHPQLSCLIEVLTAPDAPCALTDQTCVCESTALKASMQSCILGNCTIIEALAAQNISATTCGEPVRDQGGQLSVMAYILLSLAFGALLVRLYVRICLHDAGSIGLDDWSILVAAILGIPATLILTLGVVKSGLGRDIWTLKPSQITSFAWWFYILQIGYNVAVPLLKQSMLFFYLRVFPNRPIRRLLWGTIAFNLAYALVFSLSAAFGCMPVSYFWTSWDGMHKGTCIDLNAVAWSGSSVSILVDIWMLAVPLHQIKGLNMRRKKKIGVGLMFGVGSFVTVVSIMRLHSLTKYSTTTANPTWDFTSVAVWSTLEITIGIVCTCLPTVRILLIRLWPALNDKISKRSGYEGGTGESSSNNKKRTHEDHSLGLSTDIQLSGVKANPEATTKELYGSCGLARSSTIKSKGDETLHTLNYDVSSSRSKFGIHRKATSLDTAAAADKSIKYDNDDDDDDKDTFDVHSPSVYSQVTTVTRPPTHHYSTSDPVSLRFARPSAEWRRPNHHHLFPGPSVPPRAATAATTDSSDRVLSNRLSSTFQFYTEDDLVSSYSSKTAGKSTIGRIVEDYAMDHEQQRPPQQQPPMNWEQDGSSSMYRAWPLDEPDNIPPPSRSRSRRADYGDREQWPLRRAGDQQQQQQQQQQHRGRSRSNPINHIAMA